MKDINIGSSKFLKEFISLDEDLIRSSMGDFGLSLRDFFYFLDLDHPELGALFKEFYLKDDNFLDRCFELFKLMKYAKSNQYTNSAFIFEEKLGSLFKGKTFSRSLNIRLVKDKNERHELRSLKESKEIDLYYIYSSKNFWLDFPNSFFSFTRYGTSFEEDIKEATKKKLRYEDLGCLSLAEELEKDIESIKLYNEMYYGFHQIKATTASLVLAKLLNLSFSNKGIFWDDNSAYCPFVVPVDDANCPQDLRDTIQNLESLPDASNKPIFDCFAFITPGVKDKIAKSVLVGEKEGKFYFIDLFDYLFSA
jgi:hypothetical protein